MILVKGSPCQRVGLMTVGLGLTLDSGRHVGGGGGVEAEGGPHSIGGCPGDILMSMRWGCGGIGVSLIAGERPRARRKG